MLLAAVMWPLLVAEDRPLTMLMMGEGRLRGTKEPSKRKAMLAATAPMIMRATCMMAGPPPPHTVIHSSRTRASPRATTARQRGQGRSGGLLQLPLGPKMLLLLRATTTRLMRTRGMRAKMAAKEKAPPPLAPL